MGIIARQPLGERAQGSIGESTAPTKPALDMLDGGAFTRNVSQWLIGVCGDERCNAYGSRLFVPAGFGGLASLVVTDTLTTRQWYRPGMTFMEHAITTLEAIHNEHPDAVLAVHTDTAAGQALAEAGETDTVECGCAAIANAGAVLELLIAQRDTIPLAYREAIVAHARALLATGYVQPDTARTVEKLAAAGATVEVLDGPHNGVAFIRNKRPGTVIDRPALYRACIEAGISPLYAFTYDEWAMHESARQLTDSPEAATFFAAGGDVLMLTTIRAIASPDLTEITYE